MTDTSMHTRLFHTLRDAAHGETRTFRGWHITTYRTTSGTTHAWTAHHQGTPHPPVVCHTRRELTDLVLPPHPPPPPPGETSLQQALEAGLHWLHHTEQPQGALIDHHGALLPTTIDNRKLRCVPAYNGKALITIDVARLRWIHNGDQLHPTDQIGPHELDDLAALLDQAGAPIATTLNGYPTITGTLVLQRHAHPTLVAAANRYRKGCRAHPAKGTLCPCGWYIRGRNRIIPPYIPTDERQER